MAQSSEGHLCCVLSSCPPVGTCSGLDSGKPAAFDVTVTSVLSSATINEASAAVWVAAFPAEARKQAANDDKCQELGWSCISLAIETHGNGAKEAQCTFFQLASLLAIGQASSRKNGCGHLL